MLMVCLAGISYQDFKERKVFWFLFPLAMLLFGLLLFLNTNGLKIFIYYSAINALLVTAIVTILFVYTRLFLKKTFLNHSLGLGDILFFYAFGLGFPTITFVVLFVGSIVFSLLVFLLSKKRLELSSVPLAGLMAFFLFFVVLSSIASKSTSLYAY
ncbi:hypothetical protein AAY42_05360 [Flagellimonas eckloniae]|uniref:Prepilin type IV endopeptidase peptidase domain-containing protein n=1 Tax=Flagellimonas eckloniae TaxID=346185 RepID=A0A0Q1BGD0_9FLAO|nr:hypothetical protein AAY42_05360 [Allomuricauda eckloniae]